MRASSASWMCTAAIAVGYITGIAALSPTTEEVLEDSAMSNSEGSDQDGGVIAQKVIVTVLTNTSPPETEQETPGLDETRVLNEIDIPVSVATITHESAVTILHTKITEAPSLFKRKLGSNRWDLIHEGIQGQKRDGTQCPADYSLCPKSVNGGCCPIGRICGTDSCLPASTSAAPASACGKLGYTACALAEGGGCCPSNYVCGQAGCSPSAGVTYSQTCAVNSYLCPASLGYGCCRDGMGCALKGCYTTSVSTFTLLETVTTTDASSNVRTLTNTKVAATTPVQPSGTASPDAGLIPKVASQAVAIAKVDATGAPSSGSGGLTKPQIGGIIGGSVALLITILVAAFLILRRLNKVVKVAAHNSRTSSSGPQSGQSRQNRQHPMVERPDIDAMSVDPLIVTRSEVSGSIRQPSYQSEPWGSAHEVEANSPPVFNSPFSPQAPAHSHYPRGYAAVPPSEASSGRRNHSLDSTPSSLATPNRGYFDLPIQSNRDSQVSRRPSQHGRNWSNASDQSGVSQMSDPAELDGGQQETSRRSSLSRALYGLGMGRMVSNRRRSDPPLTGGPQKKPDYPSPISPGLGHIPEASESHDNVNGAARPPTRPRGLSGTQLREAGLSNSQLREMTMHDVNLYISPAPKPTPKDYDDPNREGKSMIYG